MTAVQTIINLIDNISAPIDREWIEKVGKEYPYFVLPEILYFMRHRDQMNDDERNNMIARIAITSPDRNTLYSIIGEDAARFTSFYPNEENTITPDTYSTIDNFLDKYGSSDEKEVEILNKLIFNPTPDYAQLLAKEEEKSTPTPLELDDDASMSQNDILINKFIAKSKEQQGHFPVLPVEPPEIEEKELQTEPIEAPKEVDDSMLSESLAKIYIKQCKYSKALDIIRNISLKFPEKSIYFADQIRFLEKLIINEKFKK
ncbi:MAG: hypothetical protein RSB34_06475 [Muribaculaceae bacterium]